MKKKRLIICLAIGVLTSFLITGCGASQNENIERGMTALESLDYETAQGCFALAHEAGEDERLTLRGEGICYLAMADYENAIESFTLALSKSSGILGNMDYDMNYYLAVAYYKNGQVDQAIQIYDNIIKKRPKDSDAFYLRGCAKLQINDFDGAQPDFNRAIELKADDYNQMIDIYNVYTEYGYQEAGKEVLERILNQDSKGMSDFDKGRFCYFLGDYENGKLYLESASANPTPQTTLYLGKTYEAMGDYNYAISIYNTYLVNTKEDALIYNQMGLCQMKMEKYQDALSSFKAGMGLEDKSMIQELKYNEIVAYEYLQDFQTAAVLMSEYVKTYPDDTEAKREYDFLKTR